jgi:hypothetical protein
VAVVRAGVPIAEVVAVRPVEDQPGSAVAVLCRAHPAHRSEVIGSDVTGRGVAAPEVRGWEVAGWEVTGWEVTGWDVTGWDVIAGPG